MNWLTQLRSFPPRHLCPDRLPQKEYARLSSICCRFGGVINDDCVDGLPGLFESQAESLLQRGEDCGSGLIGGQRDIYFRGIYGVNCGVALPLHFEIVDAVK